MPIANHHENKSSTTTAAAAEQKKKTKHFDIATKSYSQSLNVVCSHSFFSFFLDSLNSCILQAIHRDSFGFVHDYFATKFHVKMSTRSMKRLWEIHHHVICWMGKSINLHVLETIFHVKCGGGGENDNDKKKTASTHSDKGEFVFAQRRF